MKNSIFKTQLEENDLFLTSSTIINELCRPLKKIGITYVTYLRNYTDNSQINLSNSADWIEHYYKFKLYNSSLFEKDDANNQAGLFLWPTESHLEVFKHGRSYFDSDNGITLIDRSNNFSEFFFFSGPRKNKFLTNLYINNLDLLENFTKFFKEQLKDILAEAEKSRILISKEKKLDWLEEDNIEKFLENELVEIKRQFTIASSESNLLSSEKNKFFAILTPREMSIVNCLLYGKTAKETAKQLTISNRTVETHLENIKIKLNCRTKFELVNKLLNSSTVI